ncbi:MAG: acyl-CoA dehydrogenase [Gammaproteobacteria bacterium]|nr:acyl-CoA dehydrogenase [Gammaproteobacteria bacterium]
MLLLNPHNLTRKHADERTLEVMEKTVAFFENKGKKRLLEDYHAHRWYADFIEYQGREGLFATICTPAGKGVDGARWDTWRICEFSEILGFYGLQYWYTWQVSVLGLGPLWMSKKPEIAQRTAAAIGKGGIFAFGLSEQAHGADIYATDMVLTPCGDGRYTASGSKYYIGNGNEAAIVSTFGRIKDSDEYVFFAAESKHPNYELVQNVCPSSNYVSEYRLNAYPVSEADILHRGDEAWNAALNTVNIGKFNLGWASIGICTHAFYEAITHAANRHLYKMTVTDFSHVRHLFVDAYARLSAMKLFALRAIDYMRSASADDRRYLLFNPMVKMKVTTQGEDVINLLWDVIAAKGFEKNSYFAQAAVDIRALPKLEGTVHVNIALIAKFMPNYFFNPAEYAPVPTMDQPVNDDFLFDQGPTRGLSKIRFHDYNPAYAAFDLPNVALFREQIALFKKMLMTAPPAGPQLKDIDFLLAGGELFALVVYGQLICENARILKVSDAMVDQIFDFMVRDFSRLALNLHDKTLTTGKQAALCLQMIRKPVVDEQRYNTVWNEVHGLSGAYEMSP